MWKHGHAEETRNPAPVAKIAALSRPWRSCPHDGGTPPRASDDERALPDAWGAAPDACRTWTLLAGRRG
jgi:hypothetical protein